VYSVYSPDQLGGHGARPLRSPAARRVLTRRTPRGDSSHRPHTLLISLQCYAASARPVRQRGTCLVHAALEPCQYTIKHLKKSDRKLHENVLKFALDKEKIKRVQELLIFASSLIALKYVQSVSFRSLLCALIKKIYARLQQHIFITIAFCYCNNHRNV
jgi:hypothetical protein